MANKKGHTAWNKGLPKEQQPMFGKKHSKKSKEMISKSETGKFVSKKTREKISKSYKLIELPAPKQTEMLSLPIRIYKKNA